MQDYVSRKSAIFVSFEELVSFKDAWSFFKIHVRNTLATVLDHEIFKCRSRKHCGLYWRQQYVTVAGNGQTEWNENVKFYFAP
jgi:hypothetical protein